MLCKKVPFLKSLIYRSTGYKQHVTQALQESERHAGSSIAVRQKKPAARKTHAARENHAAQEARAMQGIHTAQAVRVMQGIHMAQELPVIQE